jgi:hypothetical protein
LQENTCALYSVGVLLVFFLSLFTPPVSYSQFRRYPNSE